MMVVSARVETKKVQLPDLGPEEKTETALFEVPKDGLIAKVVYTPAADVRGSFDFPRVMQLAVGLQEEAESRCLADASAQNRDFFLPAGVAQNLPLMFENLLRVREGNTLYWRSHILEDRGFIPDPGGTLEIVFEPRAATEATVKGIYWPGEVPYYWIGKTAWIGYCRKPKGEPNTRYLWHHRGIVLAATETGILMDADIPPQLGIERHRAKYPYQTITNVWLV